MKIFWILNNLYGIVFLMKCEYTNYQLSHLVNIYSMMMITIYHLNVSLKIRSLINMFSIITFKIMFMVSVELKIHKADHTN